MQKRKYGWRDLIGISLSCEPWCALALLGQKLLTALVNVLWVLVEAKKRSRLKYSLIEDSAAWELCRRVSGEMKRNMTGTLSQVCDLFVRVIRIVGVLLIIFVRSPLLGVGMLFVIGPLIAVSVKSGKQTYSAYQKASENERRASYLQGVMMGRESEDERALYGIREPEMEYTA